ARVFVLGNTKEHHAGNSQPFDFAAFLEHLVDGLLIDAGLGTDLHAGAFAGADEHGIDETAGGKPRLARHGAQSFGAPQPPRPLHGKCHASLLLASIRDLPFFRPRAAKYDSSAATTDAVLASSASTSTVRPAPRMASAVTGPTAANATCASQMRGRSAPNSL